MNYFAGQCMLNLLTPTAAIWVQL